MKDALKFASVLPSMFGKSSGGNDDGSSSFNMADMMKMMSAMNQMNNGGGKKNKTAINKEGLRKLAKKAQLQKKLASKKEN